MVDKAVNAGYAYKPVTEADNEKLKKMAEGQASIFQKAEDSVALGTPYESPYPFHPHDPEMWS